MKIIFVAISIILVLILTACTHVSDVTIGKFIEQYPFNYVGLVSPSTNTDSVDVYYSVASGSVNVVQHIKVKPPVIIGGHFANIIFDSVGMRVVQGLKKPYIEHQGRRAVIDYSETGSHFMKIVNSGRYPVEYFIVGNHPIKQHNLSDFWSGAASGSAKAPVLQVVDLLPEVFYRGGPVKYLLFPNEKPTQDLYQMNTEGSLINKKDSDRPYYYYKSLDTIVFKGSYNGKNIVSRAWTVNQVMALFRAEYHQSTDTILTISYPGSNYTPKDTRISAGYVKNYSGFTVNRLMPKYYGIIPSGGEIRSSEFIPFITHVNYQYYYDKP